MRCFDRPVWIQNRFKNSIDCPPFEPHDKVEHINIHTDAGFEISFPAQFLTLSVTSKREDGDPVLEYIYENIKSQQDILLQLSLRLSCYTYSFSRALHGMKQLRVLIIQYIYRRNSALDATQLAQYLPITVTWLEIQCINEAFFSVFIERMINFANDFHTLRFNGIYLPKRTIEYLCASMERLTHLIDLNFYAKDPASYEILVCFFEKTFRPIRQLDFDISNVSLQNDLHRRLIIALTQNTRVEHLYTPFLFSPCVKLINLQQELVLTGWMTHWLQNNRTVRAIIERNKTAYNTCSTICVLMLHLRKTKRALCGIPYDLVRVIVCYVWDTRSETDCWVS